MVRRDARRAALAAEKDGGCFRRFVSISSFFFCLIEYVARAGTAAGPSGPSGRLFGRQYIIHRFHSRERARDTLALRSVNVVADTHGVRLSIPHIDTGNATTLFTP